MKKTLLLTLAVLAFAGLSWASPCPGGPGATLADYLALGSAGCTIDDKTFSNFTYVPSGNAPAAGSIGVDVINTPNNPGLLLNLFDTESGGSSADIAFNYTVTVNPGGNLINDSSLSGVLLAVGANSSVAVAESLCLGGLFSQVGGCPAADVASLAIFASGLGPKKLVDAITFSPVTVVDVHKDINIVSDKAGFAEISDETQQYSEVPTKTPEPASMLLFGSGLLAVGGALRRRFRG